MSNRFLAGGIAQGNSGVFLPSLCSEALLRERFEYAKQLQHESGRPSILFLDELVGCDGSDSARGFSASRGHRFIGGLCRRPQDALCPRREEGTSTSNRLVGQLLTLMDGTAARGDLIVRRTALLSAPDSDVSPLTFDLCYPCQTQVLAATNRPNALDPAIRRPGRFDREIALPAPDRDERLALLASLTAHLPLAGDVDLPVRSSR